MNYQLLTSNTPSNIELTIIERVLSNRGIPLHNIKHYLNTTDEDILNPEIIKNMRDGVKMLISHISQNHQIMIQVDPDVDGFTSAALLINYLNRHFPYYVENYISIRLQDGKEHGIIPNTIPQDIKLVIAPDSSSNSYDECEELSKRGVDVLVIDHHEAPMENKFACVINNQLCDYPNKSLSGVGMVYKFCSYIDKVLGTEVVNDYLDLVALGLIADMVDIKDFETKRLITKGLENINNPFFKLMVQKNEYSLGSEITPIGVAFYVAPYINATIRTGSADEKYLLFRSMLETDGNVLIPSTKRGAKPTDMETVAEQACRNCANIKNKQTKMRDAATEKIETIIKENNLLDNKILIVLLDKKNSINRNLTGLIANQLMAKYQRPVMLLNETDNGWEGSCRGYDKSSFEDFKEFITESGFALYSEGHANAFGSGFKNTKIVDDFTAYANYHLKDFNFDACYRVDIIYNANDIQSNSILEIAGLKSLWGQGIEEPYIAIENIKVSKDNVILMSKDKNPTLKITLPNGISLIKFKSSEEEFNNLYSEGYITINAVGRCEQNVWNGNVSAQVILEDYEIVKKQQYYF